MNCLYYEGCEGCGRRRDDIEPVQRASGCQLWLCAPCRRTTLALGTIDVAEQVASDRDAYAGGPRLAGEPAAAPPR